MDKTKICNVCGTANEEEYVYCKNCGSPLMTENSSQNAQYSPNHNYTNAYGVYGCYADYSEITPELDGVETAKVQAYVGNKNRNKFMQSFIAIAKTGRKAFFNWAVMLTGILLSSVFTASWFFYRKMYKVGLIICAVFVALTVCITAINFNDDAAAVSATYDKISSYSEAELTEKLMYSEDGSAITSNAFTSPLSKVVSNVVTVAEIVAVVLLSVYAYRIYYNHTLKEVKRISATGENQLYIYTLAGKPSLAAAILIPFAFNLLIAFISLAPCLPLLLSGADAYKIFLAFMFC